MKGLKLMKVGVILLILSLLALLISLQLISYAPHLKHYVEKIMTPLLIAACSIFVVGFIISEIFEKP